MWISVDFADIEKVTVVPTGTDLLAGKKRRIAVSALSLPARTSLPGGPANFASAIRRLAAFAYSFFAAFAFAFADGIGLPLATTLTVPFWPGWIVQ